MNKKLEKFMNANLPQKTTSKLQKYQDDILILKEEYSLFQIQKYLKEEHNILTSISNLSSFIKRARNKESKSKNSKINKLQNKSKQIVDPKETVQKMQEMFRTNENED